MAKDVGNVGESEHSVPKVPEANRYSPDERLEALDPIIAQAEAKLESGKKEDLQAAENLLGEVCRTMEQVLKDSEVPGRFDDSRTKSRHRGEQHREWIAGQCVLMLAYHYGQLGQCAVQLGERNAVARYCGLMVDYARRADKESDPKKGRRVLLYNLSVAGAWYVHQVEPPKPEIGFSLASEVLKEAEDWQTWEIQDETFVLNTMRTAARTLWDSIAAEPKLAVPLIESFHEFLHRANQRYSRDHYLIYKNLAADLLTLMEKTGERWYGQWLGSDVSFETYYAMTAARLLADDLIDEDPKFGDEVLQKLGTLQDLQPQMNLLSAMERYCERHIKANAVAENVRLMEDARKVLSQKGKYNCYPGVWLHTEKALARMYCHVSCYPEADAAAQAILQDVAELRQGCTQGKWNVDLNASENLRNKMDLSVFTAYAVRSAVSDHLGDKKKAEEYQNQAETLLDETKADEDYYELRCAVDVMREAYKTGESLQKAWEEAGE